MTEQNAMPIAVTGVSGRMGQMLVAAVGEREDAVLAGATSPDDLPALLWLCEAEAAASAAA